MDFVPNPREVADSPICNAIERKDFKQALKLVEKRISKKPGDGYLGALRCYIQCSHPQPSERGSGLATFIGLSDENDATRFSQIEILELYDEAAKVLFLHNDGAESKAVCRMRVKAVQAEPKDEKLAIACFRACLLRHDWASVETIAVSLDKNFPSKHNYPFWAITAKWIISQSATVSATQKTLFSTLAYRQIKALAEVTCKVGETGILPPRSVQTPQELYLLHRLVSEKGGKEENLHYYQNPLLGADSKVAKGSWDMRRREILIMRDLEDWKTLFETCHKLLSDAVPVNSNSRGSDWTIWESYVHAASRLGTSEAWNATIEQIRAHLKGNIKGRNAALAAVEVHFCSGWTALQKFYQPIPYKKRDFMPGTFKFDQDLTRFAVTDTEYVRINGYWFPRSLSDGHSVGDWGHISHRVVAICEALWRYSGMVAAFRDMKGYIGKLTGLELRDLLKILPFVHQDLHIGPDVLHGKGYPPPGSQNDGVAAIDCSTTMKIQYFIQSSLAESYRTIGPNSSKPGSANSVCAYCACRCEIYCANCLESISSAAIEHYGKFSSIKSLAAMNLLATDKNPADDMAIVAAMCLIKLSGAVPNPEASFHVEPKRLDLQRLMQATALLEYAASNSKANPELSLLLIRLYQIMGAGSLAMRAFNRLGIKQIQLDTLGYVLFDRISTLHPHSVADGTEILDPIASLSRFQQFYRKVRGQISSNAWKSFEHGSYDSVFQLLDAHQKITLSASSVMSTVELRRITRMIDPSAVLDKKTHGYDILLENSAFQTYTDNCDKRPFPNYECESMPSFEQYLLLGPDLGSERCQAMLIIEELWMAISNSSDLGSHRDLTHGRLEALGDKANKLLGTASTTFYTLPEFNHVFVALFLVRIVRLVHDSVSKEWAVQDHHSVNMIVEKIDKISKTLCKAQLNDQNFAPTFTDLLHPLYTAHEIANLILAVVKHLQQPTVADKMKHLTDKVIVPLTDAAKKLLPIVVQKGNEARKFINSGGLLDRISTNVQSEENDTEKMKRAAARAEKAREMDSLYNKDGTVGMDLAILFGEDYADYTEFWASELVDSWRECSIGLSCLKSNF